MTELRRAGVLPDLGLSWWLLCAADPEVDAKLTRIDRAYQAELSRLTQQIGKPEK